MEMQYLSAFPVMSYKRFPLDYKFNQYFKRIFDFIFAFLVCVCVLSWLVPLVALAIKLDDGGKVFYVQKRIGFKGRRFNCLKFRSMRPSNENDIKNTQKDDDRITRVGKFLRKTSLDEFPQFLNVFVGSMSIVGPRPHMISEDEYYKKNIREYFLRHFVPPGITGLAQTSGLRGAVEGISGMERRIVADTYYISKWSFMLDIYIIFKTFFGLFKNDENAF
jgi:putative colanic acid biosynthesis UDP-glucose lipid carrier transferase